MYLTKHRYSSDAVLWLLLPAASLNVFYLTLLTLAPPLSLAKFASSKCKAIYSAPRAQLTDSCVFDPSLICERKPGAKSSRPIRPNRLSYV